MSVVGFRLVHAWGVDVEELLRPEGVGRAKGVGT